MVCATLVTAGCFGSTSSPQPRMVTIPKGGDNSSINSTTVRLHEDGSSQSPNTGRWRQMTAGGSDRESARRLKGAGRHLGYGFGDNHSWLAALRFARFRVPAIVGLTLGQAIKRLARAESPG